MCLLPHTMIKKEWKRAQQTNSVTHEQRGKYDFFLPNKKKEKTLNINTNTMFTPHPKTAHLPTQKKSHWLTKLG